MQLRKMDSASSPIKCHNVWSALKAKLLVSCCSGNCNKFKATDYYRDLSARILPSLIAIISAHCSLVARAADNNKC